MSIHEASTDGQAMPATGSSPGPAATEDAPAPVENIQTGAAPQPSQPGIKTFFGLPRDSRRQGFSRPAFDDDYVERFPEDPYGHEAAPKARIWRVYGEEAAAYDENMVGQSRDGLDVMLVFAGLFSAVVTSFLVQVSQNLQADFSQMSALLLHDLLVVQLAVADGAAVNVTTPSINPTEKFEPDAVDVWINGLWVVSLTASLVVALSAVLIKQWLHRYMTLPSGIPRLRSHVRQFRFMGLEKWRVRIIVGMLPIIMHISLMLFFAGLILFYVPLCASLAWAVGTITVLVCVLYLASNTIPIIDPQCPYQTPLTGFIHHICQVVQFSIRRVQFGIRHCVIPYRGIIHMPAAPSRFSLPPEFPDQDWDVLDGNFKSLTQLELDAVGAAHANLSVDGLDWLYHVSSNPTVHTLVLQGISGLPAESHSYAFRKWEVATDMQTQRHQLVRDATQNNNFLNQPSVERLFRSHLFLPKGRERISLERILDEKASGWDPHIEAAMRLGYHKLWSYNCPIDFFIRHSEVLMPPLLWEEIINNMLHLRSWEYSELARFLSAVICPSLATSPSALLMTGPHVVWTRLQPQFWDMILKIDPLVIYDTVSSGGISSYNRMLIAAGKLVLSLVQQYHRDVDNSAQQHLKLLARVVRLITSPDMSWDTDYHQAVSDFLPSVLEQIQDVSFRAIESENDIRVCLKYLLSFYRRSSSRMPEIRLPSIDRFWARFYNSIRYDSVFKWSRPSDLKTPMIVLRRALFAGNEEAYQMFTSRGWMEITFTEWVICGDTDHGSGDICQTVASYIRGLYTMVPDSARRKFCEYLHQPPQLILASMLLIATDQEVDQLVKICPTHTSWSDCVTALEAIRKWGQTPDRLEISLFAWPPCLETLKTREAFRKYPLVEWTARRFADPDTQNNLKIALEALHKVLDRDAEHVDGVLMPDLENQPEHEPQRAHDETSAPESEGSHVASSGD